MCLKRSCANFINAKIGVIYRPQSSACASAFVAFQRFSGSTFKVFTDTKFALCVNCRASNVHASNHQINKRPLMSPLTRSCNSNFRFVLDSFQNC